MLPVTMRRFGWQIGGLTIAIGAVVALGILVFARSPANAPAQHTALPTASARTTATPDARVAAVEAAARRYVEALATSMRTGSPDELDSLSVPGSQAEGNAGITAHVVHDASKAFVVTKLDVTSLSIDMLGSTDATATITYALTGYDAAWPSLNEIAAQRRIEAQRKLELTLLTGQWLVATEQ